MSRLLTQEEVDALLAAIDSEDADFDEPAEHALYDLRAPIVLAGERLALVHTACERIAEVLGDAITVLFGGERRVSASFTSLLQQPARAVVAALPPSSALGVLVSQDGVVQGGLALQPELALSLVDRAQGGTGHVHSGPRTLSPVESTLLASAIEAVVRALSQKTTLGSIRFDGIEVEPEAGRLVARGGTLCAVMIRVATDQGDAMCRLLLSPALVHRLVLTAAAPRHEHVSESLAIALGEVPVRIAPAITGATIRLGDLVRLDEGQVLDLESREPDAAALRLNGEVLVRGHLMGRGAARVFRIEAFRDEAQPKTAPALETPEP